MKIPVVFLTLISSLLFASPAISGEQAWIMSIPHAYSNEHIYKVRIKAIDGEAQPEVFRYPATTGKHVISVELMLDIEWEPDLTASSAQPRIKQIELTVESGKSYLLAASVDVNAPVESQLDQSYWEVFVYREY